MIAFDFFHEPEPGIVARVRAIRIPERVAIGLLAWAIAGAVLGISWTVDTVRIARARDVERRLAIDYADLGVRLDRAKIDVRGAGDIGALDGRLRDIAASAPAMRRRLGAIALELPSNTWLLSLADDPDGTNLIGRGFNVASVARTLTDLSGSRFGSTALQRITRVERAERPLVEFAVRLERR